MQSLWLIQAMGHELIEQGYNWQEGNAYKEWESETRSRERGKTRTGVRTLKTQDIEKQGKKGTLIIDFVKKM